MFGGNKVPWMLRSAPRSPSPISRLISPAPRQSHHPGSRRSTPTAPCPRQPTIVVFNLFRHPFLRVPLLVELAGARTEPLAQSGVASEPGDGLAKGIRIARSHKVAVVAILDDLAHPPDISADHRPAKHHRLHQDQAKGLIPRGCYEDVTPRIMSAKGLVIHLPVERNTMAPFASGLVPLEFRTHGRTIVRDAIVSNYRESKLRKGVAECRSTGENRIDSLPRLQPADEEHRNSVGIAAQLKAVSRVRQPVRYVPDSALG